MIETRFEWDEEKNLSNQQKHGVSFELAVLAFADPLVVSYKEREVDGEERWQTYGRLRDCCFCWSRTRFGMRRPGKR